jgi:hypothetical protein
MTDCFWPKADARKQIDVISRYWQAVNSWRVTMKIERSCFTLPIVGQVDGARGKAGTASYNGKKACTPAYQL